MSTVEQPERVILPAGPAEGALRATATSHIGLRVPDPAAAASFYGRVLGLSLHGEAPGGGLRLGWGSGHHVLDLVPGEPGLAHAGFEVRDPDGLAGLRERLAAAGAEVSELDPAHVDAAEGAAEGISVLDPDGNTVHLHGPVRREGEFDADSARRPVKYQHVTYSSADVAGMTAFYAGVLGFRISDQLADGRFAWLRSNRDHHTVAVVHTGQRGGIDHYSYDLAEWEDFKTWCDRMTDEEVPIAWGPGRHGPGNNLFLFFDDPAGNHVEFSAEMEKFHDDRVEYATRRWQPRPSSVNLWGGQLPTWRRTSGSDAPPSV